jgi:hypothetical protein
LKDDVFGRGFSGHSADLYLTRCYPPGGKGRSKLKRKQNKYLTEEAKKPYGRLQPTTSIKEKEKKKKQQKQQHQKQRNPTGMLAPNINS